MLGELCAYLKKKGALKPMTAVSFALDIARLVKWLYTLVAIYFIDNIDPYVGVESINPMVFNFMQCLFEVEILSFTL